MDKIGGSRLLQMQVRYQQKQLQEREIKIASLYEAQQTKALDRVRRSPSTGARGPAPSPALAQHPGKVRQMFEERRTKGVDKSYPLQPIHSTEKTQAKKPLSNGFSKLNSKPLERKTTSGTAAAVSSHRVNKQVAQQVQRAEHRPDLNHNQEPGLGVGVLARSPERPARDNNYLLENETFPEALAPQRTPRSPGPAAPRPPRPPAARKSTVPPPADRPGPTRTSRPQPTGPPTKPVTDGSAVRPEESKARGVMHRSANPVPTINSRNPVSPRAHGHGPSSAHKGGRGATSPGAGAEGGDACAVCGRHFAPDRLAKHQDICRKTHTKKRKPYDVLKHRLAGTEAEPFINKLRKPVTNQSSTKLTSKSLNNNWRQKHEEFIQAIRAAKQVQAHLNAGGKLSDLPPPPPSENPDYVQCPHCNRRFNQAAAERHIPKCASFQFNKPKPPARRR